MFSSVASLSIAALNKNINKMLLIQLKKAFLYVLICTRSEPEFETFKETWSRFQVINSVSLCVLAARAGLFKHSVGARNQGEIGFSYRPARLHWLAELMSRNRFLSSLNV
jgi:hypothetical protein